MNIETNQAAFFMDYEGKPITHLSAATVALGGNGWGRKNSVYVKIIAIQPEGIAHVEIVKSSKSSIWNKGDQTTIGTWWLKVI